MEKLYRVPQSMIVEYNIKKSVYLYKSKCGMYQLSCLNDGCVFYLTKDELKKFPIREVFVFKNNELPAIKMKIEEVLDISLSDVNKYTSEYNVSYNKINEEIEEIIVSRNSKSFIHGVILYVNNMKFIQILTNYISGCIYNEQDFFAEMDMKEKNIKCRTDDTLIIKNLSNKVVNYFESKINLT
jgi:hypothetical protein